MNIQKQIQNYLALQYAVKKILKLKNNAIEHVWPNPIKIAERISKLIAVEILSKVMPKLLPEKVTENLRNNFFMKCPKHGSINSLSNWWISLQKNGVRILKFITQGFSEGIVKEVRQKLETEFNK